MGWHRPHPTSSQAPGRKHSISSCHTKERSSLPLKRLPGTSWSRMVIHRPIFSISAPDILYCGNTGSLAAQISQHCSCDPFFFQTDDRVSLGNSCRSHFKLWYVMLMLPNSTSWNMISRYARPWRRVKACQFRYILKGEHFTGYLTEDWIVYDIFRYGNMKRMLSFHVTLNNAKWFFIFSIWWWWEDEVQIFSQSSRDKWVSR